MRLLTRRAQLLAKLPPLEDVLRGSLVQRSVRCGKPRCRCATGARHPTVSLSVTHRGGRTEQISIPPDLIATVRHGLAVYHRWWDLLEQVAAINRELLRDRRTRGGGAADETRRGTASRRRGVARAKR